MAITLLCDLDGTLLPRPYNVAPADDPSSGSTYMLQQHDDDGRDTSQSQRRPGIRTSRPSLGLGCHGRRYYGKSAGDASAAIFRRAPAKASKGWTRHAGRPDRIAALRAAFGGRPTDAR